MRIFGILSLALIVGCSATNEPAKVETVELRLDSIEVDEIKSELTLFGKFGASADTVFCDSMSLPVISAADTVIRALIPVYGKGSCGKIWVKSNQASSNSRLLSYWHYWAHYDLKHPYSDGGADFEARMDSIHIRFDYEAKYRLNKQFYHRPTSKSFYYKFADGYGGRFHEYTGPKYNYYGVPEQILVSIDREGKGGFYNTFTELGSGWDINFDPEAYSNGCPNGNIGICTEGGPIIKTQFPPGR
jgi:hypothetical protein